MIQPNKCDLRKGGSECQDQLLQRPSSLEGWRLRAGPEHLDSVFHKLALTWPRPEFQGLALSLESTDSEAPGWGIGEPGDKDALGISASA